jgi:hypothetical protein
MAFSMFFFLFLPSPFTFLPTSSLISYKH